MNIKEDILKELDKKFDFETVFGEDSKAKKAIVDFISKSIDQALTARDEEWKSHIESYFKGLIHIPYPQATKDKLINSMN